MHQPQRSLTSCLGALTFGTALGAGLMFLLDPVNGHRRRAALRRLLSGLHDGGGEPVSDASDGEGVRSGDVQQRARNLAAAVRARLHRHRDGGRTLEARVRARLGRVATNPGAIAVIAEGTRVTLRGAVPPDELDDVLDEVSAVEGVHEVYNLLQVQLAAPPIPGHN
jgi:BON domain